MVAPSLFNLQPLDKRTIQSYGWIKMQTGYNEKFFYLDSDKDGKLGQ
jgi:hypothetical protein